MSKFVSAYLIYNAANNTYVDDGTLVVLNCERLQAFTPRRVWLQRALVPGDGTDIQYMLTFNASSTDVTQYGTNLIQGFYVEQDGQGMMVDVADINTIISACNACCDDSPVATLTRYYTGGITLFATPVAANFCITRLDDGSLDAHRQIAMSYAGQYVGNMRLVSNLSGTSKYSVQSYTGWPPVAQGSDTVASGYCS